MKLKICECKDCESYFKKDEKIEGKEDKSNEYEEALLKLLSFKRVKQ
jgi:hypothetical protein